MMKRGVVLGGIALLAVGIGIFAILNRSTVEEPERRSAQPVAFPELPKPPEVDPTPAVTTGRVKPVPPPVAVITSKPPIPVGPAWPEELVSWRKVVVSEEPDGLARAYAMLQVLDTTQRDEVLRMAEEDEDHRVRMVIVDFMIRSKQPPPEEFFINRLDLDEHEGPREKAALALELYGTADALQVLDRVMNEETDKRVRHRAVSAALVIRRKLRR